jgi:hypothetical protein
MGGLVVVCDSSRTYPHRVTKYQTLDWHFNMSIYFTMIDSLQDNLTLTLLLFGIDLVAILFKFMNL